MSSHQSLYTLCDVRGFGHHLVRELILITFRLVNLSENILNETFMGCDHCLDNLGGVRELELSQVVNLV